jgi:hypothetical protein
LARQVQIILAGPPDDACGLYAGTLLDQLGCLAGKLERPWLVGGDWNMTGLFFHILGNLIPTDELIFFRGIETTNQLGIFSDFSVTEVAFL